MKYKLFLRFFLLYLTTLCVACTHLSYSTTDLSFFTSKADTTVASTARPYSKGANLEVKADTLWLRSLPLLDSIPLLKGDPLVIAEISIHPEDSVDSVWVKVARDQNTMGWVAEKSLLPHTVPNDPIAQGIHFFSQTHTLVFLLITAIFLLWFFLLKVRQKPTRLLWFNDIDSVFPISLSWVLAATATVYNSIQTFVPQQWQAYYYAPSLSPFDYEGWLMVLLIGFWLILLLGLALLDDLIRAEKGETALFYVVGLGAAYVVIYVLFTLVWVYVAYVLFIIYTVFCIYLLRKNNAPTLQCGQCGSPIAQRGKCPRCGAINE